MKISIFIVFCIPVIQFILMKMEKQKKQERFSGTIYYSQAYQKLCIICLLILILLAGVLCLRFKEDIYTIGVLFSVFIIILEMVLLFFRQYKIQINEEMITVTCFLRKKRAFKLEEISEISETMNGSFKLYVNGKKMAVVDVAAIGYKEFKKILEDKQLLKGNYV